MNARPGGYEGRKEKKIAYMTKSIEQLFEAYAFENGRICREEAEATKRLIVEELYRRLKASVDMLQTASGADVEQIYKQFIEH